MELIKISASKLKIMLSLPDMEKYELEADRLDCADKHTREAFRHIFDDAKTQVDFDTSGERLFIQLYTSRGGGCEIFVTKLGLPEPSDHSGCISNINDTSYQKDRLTSPERALLGKVFKGAERNSNSLTERQESRMNDQQTHDVSDSTYPTHLQGSVRPVAFSFDDLNILLAVCRRLLSIDFNGESHAYIDSKNIYYLILGIPSVNIYRMSDKYSFLAEYGHRLPADKVDRYLSEHATLLCKKDAVSKLGIC